MEWSCIHTDSVIADDQVVGRYPMEFSNSLTSLGLDFIEALLINGNLIAHHKLIPSDSNLPIILETKQFSTCLSHAVTIKKLVRTDHWYRHGIGMLYLPQSVYSHGYEDRWVLILKKNNDLNL